MVSYIRRNPYFAEGTGLEPAHRMNDTGFQDRGDTNYALPFQFFSTGDRLRSDDWRFGISHVANYATPVFYLVVLDGNDPSSLVFQTNT